MRLQLSFAQLRAILQLVDQWLVGGRQIHLETVDIELDGFSDDFKEFALIKRSPRSPQFVKRLSAATAHVPSSSLSSYLVRDVATKNLQ